MFKKSILPLLEGFLLFWALACFYVSGISRVTFQPDESQWIGTSAVFEAYFSGDFDSPLWQMSYWTTTQPPLARYVIGLGRRAGGLDTADLNAPWDWQQDVQTNTAAGRMPSAQLLWWSRLPMALLEALSVLIGFVLLKRTGGRTPAYLWVGLALLSSYLPQMLGRAMGESTLLACVTGCVWLSARLLRNSAEKPQPLYLDFLFLGILIGLAESAKLNGLAVLAAGFALVLIISLRLKLDRALKLRFGLISALILILASQFTFLALNPFLWRDPFTRTGMLFRDRIFEMRLQQLQYPAARLSGLLAHIQVEVPRIFQDYAGLHFDGAMWLNLAFCFIGLALLGIKAIKFLKGQGAGPAAMAILFIGGAVTFPSLCTPLDWDRYYLFPVYFSTLAIAAGMGGLLSLIFRLINKRPKQVTLPSESN